MRPRNPFRRRSDSARAGRSRGAAVPYDILVLAAHKDYPKVRFVLEAALRNLDGCEGVYFCSPEPVRLTGLPSEVRYLLDMEVLEAEPNRWKHRPNWVYQQFLKLFQEATPNDMYFVIDADTIINRPLRLFDDGQPVWWIGRDQFHEPYFRFSESALGVGKVYPRSFIADMFFFSRRRVRRMLSENGYTVESFIERSYELVTPACYPSEAEMYMSYLCARHPEEYAIRELRTTYSGRSQEDPLDTAWSAEDVRSVVEDMRDKPYDTFSLHSWCDTSHDSWTPKGGG